eukprot:11647580-Ditylum_brightwellii.AAC.1
MLGMITKVTRKDGNALGKMYIIETIQRMNTLIGKSLPNKDTLMPDSGHPEEDKSYSLDNE